MSELPLIPPSRAPARAWRLARRVLLALCVPVIASCVSLQAPPGDRQSEPAVGQAGKDVMWLPTPQALVEKMLDLAKVTPNDYVIDLGSGDGRTVVAAAKRGARALGIEYDPDLVEVSRRNAEREGVSGKAGFIRADIFESDFSPATVITMFLLTELNLKLRPKILALKPGTRIVSNTFKMDDWAPDGTATTGCGSFCTAYLWIVPASVAGAWRLPQGALTMTQRYQVVSGTLKSGSGVVPIGNAKFRGDQISFIAAGAQYSGRVGPNVMEGQVRSGGRTDRWTAIRAGEPGGSTSPAWFRAGTRMRCCALLGI